LARIVVVRRDPRYPDGRSWPQQERIGFGKIDSAGYLRVGMFDGERRAGMFLHEAVMLAFVGPKPPGKEVLHCNGVKKNCRLDNLIYGTRRRNSLDQIRMNERSDYIPVEMIKEIRQYFDEGGSRPQAVKLFGVSYMQANRIYHRTAYKSVIG
jgi:hypothetical protein